MWCINICTDCEGKGEGEGEGEGALLGGGGIPGATLERLNKKPNIPRTFVIQSAVTCSQPSEFIWTDEHHFV
jgi:hypothetical protein